jgi:hypothetical protein
MPKGISTKLSWWTIFLNHLAYYEHAVFYASSNKLNHAAKAIDDMFHVMKDRIQDQAINVKHMSKIFMIYRSVYRSLSIHIYDYVAIMGCWKAFLS